MTRGHNGAQPRRRTFTQFGCPKRTEVGVHPGPVGAFEAATIDNRARRSVGGGEGRGRGRAVCKNIPEQQGASELRPSCRSQVILGPVVLAKCAVKDGHGGELAGPGASVRRSESLTGPRGVRSALNTDEPEVTETLCGAANRVHSFP